MEESYSSATITVGEVHLCHIQLVVIFQVHSPMVEVVASINARLQFCILVLKRNHLLSKCLLRADACVLSFQIIPLRGDVAALGVQASLLVGMCCRVNDISSNMVVRV